jgi:hypothetical protein
VLNHDLLKARLRVYDKYKRQETTELSPTLNGLNNQ